MPILSRVIVKPIELNEEYIIIDITDFFEEIDRNQYFIVKIGEPLFGECYAYEFCKQWPSGFPTIEEAISAFGVAS